VKACLARYAWPGNVRELKNVIQRAAALAGGEAITLNELPPSLLSKHKPRAEPLRDSERISILHALEASPGNLSRVAEQLGIGRTTLYRKLKKHGLERYWTAANRSKRADR
jgi:transcriptional activator for dhaKLM operon